jgi:hypothetical protein
MDAAIVSSTRSVRASKSATVRVVCKGGAVLIWRTVAHRLCRLIWKILHDGIRYEERGGERQKQQVRARAARMIRQLRTLDYRVELVLPTDSPA